MKSVDFDLLKRPSAVYRGKPFWAWNGKIEKDEVERQVIALKKMGFGGAFIHSRTGLVTEYMSDEWLSDVKFAAEKLHENGLEAYLYDEDRWPSGTCGGYVTEEKRFRAKYMIYDEVVGEYKKPENFIGLFAVKFKGEYAEDYRRISTPNEKRDDERVFVFYYDYMLPDTFYNGYTYADTMNRAATERFLELTHEKYYAAFGDLFGTVIKGIFTDEPHRNPYLNGFGRKEPRAEKEIPYTYDLFDEFEKRKGYKIQSRLPLLWFGDAKNEFCKEAYDLIEVEQELFLENFAVPYRNWCRAHGILVTGHVLHEDNLAAQTTMCGSVMRYYEYMDMPGMDNLCEDNFAVNVPSLVKSVAKQLGKKFVLDELYAATGWKMTFADYKRTGEWQSFGGINLRCPHLSWYTMKGQAKRDYPASFLTQSAWYEDHDYIESYFSRLQYLLTEGEEETDAAVINPVESLWGLVNERSFINCFGSTNEKILKLEREYYELFRFIRLNGGAADYIDEGIFEEHGYAENGEIVVGEKRYKKIILNGNINLRSATLTALKRFISDGGTVILAGDEPEYLDGLRHDYSDDLQGATVVGFDPKKVLNFIKKSDYKTNSDSIIAEKRRFAGGEAYFFLSRAEGKNHAKITVSSDKNPARINLTDGSLTPIEFTRNGREIEIEKTFERGEALALYFSSTPPNCEKKKRYEAVSAPEEFDYELSEPNLLPLDSARCYVDGEYFCEGYILTVDEKLRDKFSLPRRHGEMIQPWFKDKFCPAPKAVCRVTLVFEFSVNETPKDVYLMTEDASADIAINGVTLAEKEISNGFIDVCFKKIKLPVNSLKIGRNEIAVSFDFTDRYDIESVYLVGTFGVSENDEITLMPKTLRAGDVCKQGLKYYGGRIKYSAPFPNGNYKITLSELPAAIAYFNDSPVAFLPYETEFAVTNGTLTAETVFTRQNAFGTTVTDGKRDGLIPQGLPEILTISKRV